MEGGGGATLWERLRRATLTRALAVYAGVGFAVLQGADIFTGQFGLPDWFFTGTLVLLLLGLLLVVSKAFLHDRRAAMSIANDRAAGEEGSAGVEETAGAERAAGERATERDAETGTGGPPGRSERSGAGWRRPVLTWRQVTWGGVLALAGWGLIVALYMGMRTLGIGPVASLVAAGVLDAQERVILSEFESRTGDTLLAAAVTEAFRVDLAQSPMLTVMDPGYLTRVLGRMERDPASRLHLGLAREIAVREGMKAVIGGEVNQVGGGFVLTAHLVGAEGGDILAGFRETATDSAGVIPAIDRLSKSMRERIGESLRTLRGNEPLAQVTTGSLVALRKYSQGVRAIDRGDLPQGIALLEEAVALDTAFAMAYRKLGVVHQQRTEAVEALRRAHAHLDRLTDRERYLTLGTYHQFVTLDLERAATAYRTLLELHPNDSWALNNLGVVHMDMGAYEDAEDAYRSALTVDSSSAMYHTNLIKAQVARGKLEEAERTLESVLLRAPDHHNTPITAANLAFVLGEYDRAENILVDFRNARLGVPVLRVQASIRLAQLAQARGRYGEADRHLADALEVVGETGRGAMILGIEFHRIVASLSLENDAAAALRGLETVLERHPLESIPPLERPYLFLAIIYAEAGLPDRARALIEEFEAAVDPELRRAERPFPQIARAQIALAEGRPEGAIAELRSAEAESDCPVCMLPFLAGAYDRAGHADSALAVYRRYVETPWLDRLDIDWFSLGTAYDRLAALHTARGDRDGAARYYERLVRLWDGADPALQPRVEAARRSLRTLASD